MESPKALESMFNLKTNSEKFKFIVQDWNNRKHMVYEWAMKELEDIKIKRILNKSGKELEVPKELEDLRKIKKNMKENNSSSETKVNLYDMENRVYKNQIVQDYLEAKWKAEVSNKTNYEWLIEIKQNIRKDHPMIFELENKINQFKKFVERKDVYRVLAVNDKPIETKRFEKDENINQALNEFSGKVCSWED